MNKTREETHQVHIRIPEPAWQKLRLISFFKKQAIQDLVIENGVTPLIQRYSEITIDGVDSLGNHIRA